MIQLDFKIRDRDLASESANRFAIRTIDQWIPTDLQYKLDELISNQWSRLLAYFRPVIW
jgi:hypothetical protein